MPDKLLPTSVLLPALWAGHFFFAVLFLQSGLDKAFNFKANLSWVKEQFKNTLISSIVTPVFVLLGAMELSSGASSAACLYFLGTGDTCTSQAALMLCATTLLALLFGQRISKDYQGSASIAGYFAVCLLSLIILYHFEM